MLIDYLIPNKRLPNHEDLDEIIKDIDFWRLSFDCDKNYVDGKDSRGHNIIWKELCESYDEYELKKVKTSIRPYAGSIIQKFRNYIFRNEPTRSELIEDFYNNCDLYGSTLNDFFSDCLLRAQVDGSCYIIPDTTGSTGKLSLAQAREQVMRPFLRKIKREHVVDWEKVDGFLTEAIIMLEDEEGYPFARYINDTIYIDITINNNNLMEVIGEPIPHGFPKFPLVELTTEYFPGGSQISQMAWAQKHIHNILAQLGIEVGENTYTRHILTMDEFPLDTDGKPINPDILMGPRRLTILTGSNGSTKMEKVGNASPEQATSLREQLQSEIDNLYIVAGLQTPLSKSGAEVKSGAALYLETNDMGVVLDSLARECESVENEVLRLVFPDYEGTSYESDFTPKDPQKDLLIIRDLQSLEFPPEIINDLKIKFAEKYI